MVRTKGFTMLEMIVVLIIVGILATLAITQYGGYRESTLNKEAQANLKLIKSAERIYNMEIGNYYPSAGSQSGNANLNDNLKLDLPGGSNRNWDYTVWSTGCARATRVNGPDTRSWSLNVTSEDPSSGNVCP